MGCTSFFGPPTNIYIISIPHTKESLNGLSICQFCAGTPFYVSSPEYVGGPPTWFVQQKIPPPLQIKCLGWNQPKRCPRAQRCFFAPAKVFPGKFRREIKENIIVDLFVPVRKKVGGSPPF
ncbi:hypothetical protein JTE90_022909 [Oedothorax gibbosus]|uniref:Uncharacterized protein n=1 Tax=Oedothorax gibbosus TaxID=931172 RepID=A0AAV6THA4_9ARAC|nr:hypothetical protein JTE90_022909 [Oedothorax gibbosus]